MSPKKNTKAATAKKTKTKLPAVTNPAKLFVAIERRLKKQNQRQQASEQEDARSENNPSAVVATKNGTGKSEKKKKKNKKQKQLNDPPEKKPLTSDEIEELAALFSKGLKWNDDTDDGFKRGVKKAVEETKKKNKSKGQKVAPASTTPEFEPPKINADETILLDGQEDTHVPDLLADPIALLRADRVKNVGPFRPANKNTDEIKVKSLQDIMFPKEYDYLLGMRRLDEFTLAKHKELWARVNSQPAGTKEIIEKEVALICLDWAQARLDQSIPVYNMGVLGFVNVRYTLDRKTALVRMCLQSLERNKSAKRQRIRRGSILMIRSANESDEREDVWARVIWFDEEKKTMEVRVAIKDADKPANRLRLSELFSVHKEKVRVFELQPDFVPQSKLRSIERLRKGEFDHLINPTPKFENVSKTDLRQSLQAILPALQNYTSLNKLQSRALYSVCASTHKNLPFVLFGPPGTGKTRVIAETVRCLLEMDPDFRVLLTAPSNMAADMIALKLMEGFRASSVMHAGNVLRLRSLGSDYHDRERKLDPICYINHEEECFEIPASLVGYRVIISTLGCSSHLVERESGFFTHIFLDEAGQAFESDIWIPLGGLATANTSIVLCGDPKQLGPVVTLELPPRITNGFQSPLVRYMAMDKYASGDKRLVCQLTQSYRCHPAILSIASGIFYDGQLESSTRGRREPYEQWECLPNKGFPLLFVEVKGDEHDDSGRRSFANQNQASAVAAYVRKLLGELDTSCQDIGIICPYRNQVRLMRSELNKTNIDGAKSITVDSVERFQGSERNVIIISTVRTKGLGFVACNLRTNTSITRAKHLLVVVGNSANLNRHKSWRSFLDYCYKNRSVITWNGTVRTFE